MNDEMNLEKVLPLKKKRSAKGERFRNLTYVSKRQYCFVFLTLVLMMITGILTVYFTAPSLNNNVCQIKFRKTIVDPVDYISHPTSVATGDFNGDKILDVIIAYSHKNILQVFFGTGDGDFVNRTTYYLNPNAKPISIKTGYINNDHVLDIAVANYGTHTIDIYLGSSNGSFQFYRNIFTDKCRPLSISIADFNLDGSIDIALVGLGTHKVSIFYSIFNENDSKMVHLSISEETYLKEFCAVDLNNDQWLDLVIVDSSSNAIIVFLQRNDSTFSRQLTYSMRFDSRPSAIIAADFNDDGLADIAITNFKTKHLIVMLGFGDGSFYQKDIHYFDGLSPLRLCSGHFDQDRFLDLAVVGEGQQDIVFLFGMGTGQFSRLNEFTTKLDQSNSIISGDFNYDRLDDIIVVNTDHNSVHVILSLPQLFQTSETYMVGLGPISIATTDINHDSYLDFITADRDNKTATVFIGLGNGSFTSAGYYMTGDTPEYIKVDDFNNDNHPDMVILNSLDHTVGVYLGDGQGNFTDPIVTSIQLYPKRATVADFNKDDNIDLAIVHWPLSVISILHGYGNGSFYTYQLLSTLSESSSVVVLDFNQDQMLDLVMSNYRNNSISVYLGHSNGSFTFHTTYRTGNGPSCMSTGDLNNDNILDLVVAHKLSNVLIVYLTSRSGGFTEQITYTTISTVANVLITNTNSDSVNDVIVAHDEKNLIDIFFGYGDGIFKRHGSYMTGSGPNGLAVGDFNRDNHTDIVVTNLGDASVSVLLQNYEDRFVIHRILSADISAALKNIACEDLNEDGFSDLAIATYGLKGIGVLMSDGHGSFPTQMMFDVNINRFNLIGIGDFNRDNASDLVGFSYDLRKTVLFLGKNDGSFNTQMHFSSGSLSPVSNMVVVDLNNDKKSDVITTSENDSSIHIMESYRVLRMLMENQRSSLSTPYFLLKNDFNQDGFNDILALSYTSALMIIFWGNSDGAFANYTIYITGRGPNSATLGDINNDEILDIIIACYDDHTLQLWLCNESGTLHRYMEVEVGVNPNFVITGDVNHDNYIDILVTIEAENSIILLLNSEKNNFIHKFRIELTETTTHMQLIDLNGDNNLDIIVVHPDDNSIGILFGYGNGEFQEQQFYEAGYTPLWTAIRDINNDHHLDIIISNLNDATVSILTGFSNGSFEREIILSCEPGPSQVEVTDMNNDGEQDIVVLHTGQNMIEIFFGIGNGSFYQIDSSRTDARPVNFLIMHLNDDENLDIVVANYWDNTLSFHLAVPNYVLRTSATLHTEIISSKRFITSGDLNNDSHIDIIVAHQDMDLIVIFFAEANFSFSSQQLLSTGKNSSVSSIVIGDFNRDYSLDILVTDTNHDELILFLATADGNFTNRLFTSIGFGSRPHSGVAFDYNGDKILDIGYINSDTNNVEILLGYGNGTFGRKVIVRTEYGIRPSAFVTGYFNNDTKVDIAVLNEINDNIQVFLQQC